ncbi:hypothetical protein M514_26461 [Trichuris suis]|uniref:Uncharacterized protein n=1 Tax=Trichuris suis TaxID=68888 RepID=A0A085MVT2_9BILA|nr:hypothetical protein M514_26461 [Trichuris suis]
MYLHTKDKNIGAFGAYTRSVINDYKHRPCVRGEFCKESAKCSLYHASDNSFHNCASVMGREVKLHDCEMNSILLSFYCSDGLAVSSKCCRCIASLPVHPSNLSHESGQKRQKGNLPLVSFS